MSATHPTAMRFIEERWDEHLQGDLTQHEMVTRLMGLTRLLLEGHDSPFLTSQVPRLTQTLDHSKLWTVDDHHVGTWLSEHLPTHRFTLSLAGRLALWCECFLKRGDIKATLNLERQPWHGIEPAIQHDGLEQMRQAFAHIGFEWSLTRSALRQKHLIPEELHETIQAYHKDGHGKITLGPWEAPVWREQVYPNSWMTVDYHAREVLKFGTHSPYSGDDLYMIAWQDEPRQEAYVGAASHVDGGSFGGIPACMTQTRYRDLETCLTMGARRGFADSWTLDEPEEQDFGAFREVERELYVPEWFDEDDAPREPGPPEEALRRRSANPEHDAERLRARLHEAGVSPFATSQLWGWLRQDIVLLLERTPEDS